MDCVPPISIAFRAPSMYITSHATQASLCAAYVNGKATFLTKQRATMFTFISFLTCVSQLVPFHMTTFGEGFTPHITGERFLPCVCAYVFCEV